MYRVFVLALAFIICSSDAASKITLTPISTDFTRPIGIDYHWPTNSLIMSANYIDGLPHNFERVEADGRHYQFSEIGGLTEELKLASVPFNNLGGFIAGDIFTGNGKDGEIVRLTDYGRVLDNPWIKLPAGTGLMRGSLYFDREGVWGGDLIVVTTNGFVFRIDANKKYTQLASTGVHLEGLSIAPNNATRYGTLAGKILAGDENNSRLWVIGTAVNDIKSYTVSVTIEDIDIVPPKQNFFGVNYGAAQLLGSPASDWVDKVGSILLTSELGCSGLCLYTMEWDNANQVPVISPVQTTPGSAIPAQWEHVTFSPSGVVQIDPVTPPCYLLRTESQEHHLTPYALPDQLTAYTYYNYSKTNGHSNFASPTAAQLSGGAITVYFTVDYRRGLAMNIIAGSPNDPQGGNAIVELTSENLQNKISIVVQDDGNDVVRGVDVMDTFNVVNNSVFQFNWEWPTGSSDGTVLGPLPSSGFCFRLAVRKASANINKILVGNVDGNNQFSFIELGLDDEPQLCVYECDRFCFLFKSCANCAPHPNCTWCNSNSHCYQSNEVPNSCGVQWDHDCPCSDYNAFGCGSCTTNPNCGWCCDSTNIENGGQCSNGTSTGPLDYQCGANNGDWHVDKCKVNNCTANCVHGSCFCGRCRCYGVYGGDNCNQTVGCDGVLGSGLTEDICGVCGGNGSSCLICGDPTLKPDSCGVCGGNGTSCFTRCPYTECSSCSLAEGCVWCTDHCTENIEGKCPADKIKTSCSEPIPIAVKVGAGIGAGVIAGIVIAAVVGAAAVGFGAKKGYDYYLSKAKSMDGVQSNPMYNDGGRTGANPFFEKPQ